MTSNLTLFVFSYTDVYVNEINYLVNELLHSMSSKYSYCFHTPLYSDKKYRFIIY